MDDSVSLLEKKLDQFLAHCESLRAENQDLCSRIARMEEEHRMLHAKIDSARCRLEALMEKIPTESTEPGPLPS